MSPRPALNGRGFAYMRLVLLSLSTLLAGGIALVHTAALAHSWYWTYPYLDVAMHLAGGALIALLAGAFFGVRWFSVVIAVGIGIVWEVFEIGIGLALIEERFVVDTLTDLVMDTLGALLAYGMMALWQSRSHLSAVPGASPDQTSL